MYRENIHTNFIILTMMTVFFFNDIIVIILRVCFSDIHTNTQIN